MVGEVTGAPRGGRAVAGHRGGVTARWRRAAVAVAAVALPLAASGIAAAPASAAGTYTVIATIPVGSQPFGIAADLAAGTAYVTNISAGTVSVINTATNTVTATIPVGSEPAGVTVDPAAGTAYVTNLIGATVSVISRPLAITTASPLPHGTAGRTYSHTLRAVGGVPPYTWSVTSGALPAGLTLNAATGAITGTPAAAGTATFSIRVRDHHGTTVTTSFTITVNGHAHRRNRSHHHRPARAPVRVFCAYTSKSAVSC